VQQNYNDFISIVVNLKAIFGKEKRTNKRNKIKTLANACFRALSPSFSPENDKENETL
jgi:hypothetical protein